MKGLKYFLFYLKQPLGCFRTLYLQSLDYVSDFNLYFSLNHNFQHFIYVLGVETVSHARQSALDAV